MFKKIKRFFTVFWQVCKRRGVKFVLFYGPKIIYCTYFKKPEKFIFNGKEYSYFHHMYNHTCLNERAVEIPIIWDIVQKNLGKRILEIGNVLSYYFNLEHDILDKYEKIDRVTNEDVVEFEPKHEYDLIVSISTLEHVGWDERPRNSRKILSAFNNLKTCLAKKGKIIVTLPIGYNEVLDNLLEKEEIRFDEQYYLKRDKDKNTWRQVAWNEVSGARYNDSLHSANGLVIGIIKNI